MGAANPPPSNGRLARKWGRLFLLCSTTNPTDLQAAGFYTFMNEKSIPLERSRSPHRRSYLTPTRSPKKMGDFMEQSIRNEIPGTVKEIISDKVLSEIIVETRIGEMAAVITTRSVQDMGLKVGDRVAALVKATNVSLRRPGF